MTAAVSNSQTRIFPWWLVLIEGIAAVVLGVLLLIRPAMTTLILVQFLGLWWFIGGLFAIVGIFMDSRMWGWKLFSGILGIIAGIIIIRHPLWSGVLVPATVVLILGIEGMIIGVVNLIQAFQGGGWGIGILGALSIIFGLVLVFNPLIAALALPWIVGILGVVGGIAAIIMAFRIK